MKSYLLPRPKYSDILDAISDIKEFVVPTSDEEDSTATVKRVHQIEILPSMTILCKKLHTTKTKLDKYYSDDEKGKEFSKIIRMFDHFRDAKYKISTEFNAQHVSNAWMKFWEMIFYFKLIPRKEKMESFPVFCNACLPGSDILVINHFIATKTPIREMDWCAASLIGGDVCLKDDYNLYANYPDRWLMSDNGEGCDGDVLSMKTQSLIKERTQTNKMLYTSDLGFDVSSNYNAQEELHAPYNLGQIVSALVSLTDGGNMVIKMYTFFTPFSLSLLTIISMVFQKLYISKPVTSKSTNSEIYIVGIGYESISTITDYLCKRLNEKDFTPLLSSSDISNWKSFQSIFSLASDRIFGEQIKHIDQAVLMFEKNEGDTKGCQSKIKLEIDKLTGHFSIVNQWYIDYPLKRLREEYMMNVSTPM